MLSPPVWEYAARAGVWCARFQAREHPTARHVDGPGCSGEAGLVLVPGEASGVMVASRAAHPPREETVSRVNACGWLWV